MSLSFSVGHWALQNWGFSAGDIAVIAGAGRAVGNWVMNQLKDQSLLEFMKVDPEDLIPRKGLIDPIELHKRWDSRLALLQNGHIRIIKTPTGIPIIENMGTFSWFMTIVISALDATLQKSAMRLAVSNFLSALFSEHVDSLDYFERELPAHIQGWISAAVVRSIAARARAVWHSLLDQGKRLPGDIPSDDVVEIVRFLVWVAGAKNQKECKQFDTASKDIAAFAYILQSIGLDSLIVALGWEGDSSSMESNLVIRYMHDAIATGLTSDEEIVKCRAQERLRSGMRVPLKCKEECVSIWPGSAGENNHRRQLFNDGIAASRSIVIEGDHRLPNTRYIITDPNTTGGIRADPIANSLASSYFPLVTHALLKSMTDIARQFPNWIDRGVVEDNLSYLKIDRNALSQVQAFTLGYFYGMLEKILDTSRLVTPEVYGSWKWYDGSLLDSLRGIMLNYEIFGRTAGNRGCHLSRKDMIRLLGMFYVGAEAEQMALVDDSTIGVHGRLSLIPSSLLGAIDSGESVRLFYLLDTDSSAIPSSIRGLITSGQATKDVRHANSIKLTAEDLRDMTQLNPKGFLEDFTSHIEPDWENDVQQCQVAFRYRGRLVCRLAPATIEYAWSGKIMELEEHRELGDGFYENSRSELRKVHTMQSKVHYVGSTGIFNIMADSMPDFASQKFNDKQPSVLFPTRGLAKARTCLVTMHHVKGFSLVSLPVAKIQWPGVRWIDPWNKNNAERTIFLYNPDDLGLFNLLYTGRQVILA